MKFKLIPNPQKDWTEDLAIRVEQYLSNDHEIVKQNADATICIGGDGTILYANHSGELEGTVIGIGSSSSYICQLEKTSWEIGLPLLLKGRTVPVMSLSATIGKKQISAINDFVLHTKDYRVVEIKLSTNEEAHSFYGDGIIFSSALGSAAYAYSAGGDLFDPLERIISVVPICPYRRAFPPKSFSEDRLLEVWVGRECPLIADGILAQDIQKDEKVIIRKGKDILFFEGVGHYK